MNERDNLQDEICQLRFELRELEKEAWVIEERLKEAQWELDHLDEEEY
jgi:hypothetical protein